MASPINDFVMVVRAHGVGLKLLLTKLVHGQIVLRENPNLDVAHFTAGLGLENRWMVLDFCLRV